MPRIRTLRPLLAALGIVLCAAPAAFAFADSPVTVTFPANNPWTQEVASVDHSDTSHEYTVSVDAGKTLYVNLISRNPNLFFKVRNETSGQRLVDTFKTGATRWSVPVDSNSTFRIEVYIERAAIPRGESAKYALQIGRIGASDMQPVTTEVTFQPNNPWAQELGKLEADATAHVYTVAMAAGNTLQVNLVTRDPIVHFKVEGPDQATLVDTASSGATTWSAPVTTAATYTIRVYVDPKLMLPGKAVGYALQVGQYPTTRTAPAAGGTAAAPATTAPMPASTSDGVAVPAATAPTPPAATPAPAPASS